MTENISAEPQGFERTKEAKDRVLESLRELPVVTTACKRAGIGKATYYRWQKEDSVFLKSSRDAYLMGIEFICDMSETQIVMLIKEKRLPAAAFWLKHNSPRYGGQTLSRTLPTQAPELTADEERLFKKALALSSSSIKNNNYAKHKHKKVE